MLNHFASNKGSHCSDTQKGYVRSFQKPISDSVNAPSTFFLKRAFL